MPLTPFQADIFQVIAAHRNPESYVAGGIVLNREATSRRFSDDIDLFHDTAEALEKSALLDETALKAAGYEFEFSKKERTFCRAQIRKGEEKARLEWAQDSAFRFFPLMHDEVLGYRLHDADAATNKVLAAVARQKVRDFIDLMELDRTYIPLGIAVWAAALKDEGWTPEWIMNELRRNCKINPETLGDVFLARREDAVALKREWLNCFERAEALMKTFPRDLFFCLLLDGKGHPARAEKYNSTWIAHKGSVKGAWPVLVE